MRWIQIDGKLVPAAEAEVILQSRSGQVAPAVHIFQEGFYEHIADKPIYIKSKKELRRVCAEHGCTSDYAE